MKIQEKLNQLDAEQREFFYAKLSQNNQLSRNEKVEFWNEMIKLFLQETTADKKTIKFIFHPHSLRKIFAFGSMKQEPACILQILRILQKEEAISELDKQDGSFSNISKFISIFKNILTGSNHDDENEEDDEKSFPQEMLHKELLDQSCIKFMKYIKSKNCLLMDDLDFEDHVKIALDIDLIDDVDLKRIEQQLIKQNRLVIGKHATITAYKLQTNPASVMAPISEVDFGRLILNRTCISLTNQIKEMNENIDRLKVETKQALKDKSKQNAIFHLKRTKMLSEIVEKRSKSLFTIEQIIEKINSAETEEKILHAYSVGSNALGSILSRTSVDKVQNTMDQLEDVLADHREIDFVMMQSQEEILATGGQEYDEKELEKELDALMEMEKDSKANDHVEEITEILAKLPITSKEIPNSSQKESTTKEALEKKSEVIAV